MNPTQAPGVAGQAVYTKSVLRLYDLVVLGISNRFIWQCPTARLLNHYNTYVTSNHLDVGVGTGYFLDHCRFPSHRPRVALMDMNANALQFASQRIARYEPVLFQQNVLQQIQASVPPFDSVGINYLLHCLPGAMSEKAVAFDHLHEVMKPDACIFGATLLQQGVPRTRMAQRLMAFYNRKGIFGNTEDGLDDLHREMTSRFRNVTVETAGCVALFAGVR